MITGWFIIYKYNAVLCTQFKVLIHLIFSVKEQISHKLTSLPEKSCFSYVQNCFFIYNIINISCYICYLFFFLMLVFFCTTDAGHSMHWGNSRKMWRRWRQWLSITGHTISIQNSFIKENYQTKWPFWFSLDVLLYCNQLLACTHLLCL